MNTTKTITIGRNTANPLTVKRLGYGTMRLTGEQVWGEPANRAEALELLQATTAVGVDFLDTADYYGEDVANRLIAEALYPYQDNLVICTKVGASRGADKSWNIYDRPENLRTSIERNLKTLKMKQIQLVHFRVMPGTDTPFEESMAAMFELQREGKILHVGLSNVTPDELNKALGMGKIASVENAFGYEQRTSFTVHGQEVRGLQEVMEACITNGIPMIPFFSLQSSLPNKENKISVIAEKYGATPAQINLAWLLHYNDLILPIPGTSKLSHFRENVKAAEIQLSKEDMEFLG
ncbi:aldo/keto reductase [Pedobacter yulinensis]|uniref:Aldo/keto reductase n=1 Tax=Pedobacter yulinensis TaxID=2126353 RepID=A0A2T3HIZ4_9SPHI|nr:aldo/keto reductase [Pedobacter yulinensis]PST82425.1 aldo/keto reductase [Pedobacter yulinensis]